MELSKLLLTEFDFGGTLVTITDVFVDTDLLQARVKLGIIPYEKGPEVYRMVEAKRRELQYQILKKLNIKPLPHLKFEIEEQK